MMVTANGLLADALVDRQVPGVVVVDPRFDAYAALAASARLGKIDLHMRSSGTAALRLVDRIHVDAWLIATELDDMSGEDFVGLLQARRGDAKVAMVDEARRSAAQQGSLEADVDARLSAPISVADLEDLLGMSIEERRRRFGGSGRTWASFPVTVGAAMIAIAVIMMS